MDGLLTNPGNTVSDVCVCVVTVRGGRRRAEADVCVRAVQSCGTITGSLCLPAKSVELKAVNTSPHSLMLMPLTPGE